MAVLTIREKCSTPLLASILEISLLENEYFKNTTQEILEMVFANIKVITTVRNMSSMTEKRRLHILFDSDEAAIEFKLKYSEFLEP